MRPIDWYCCYFKIACVCIGCACSIATLSSRCCTLPDSETDYSHTEAEKGKTVSDLPRFLLDPMHFPGGGTSHLQIIFELRGCFSMVCGLSESSSFQIQCFKILLKSGECQCLSGAWMGVRYVMKQVARCFRTNSCRRGVHS